MKNNTKKQLKNFNENVIEFDEKTNTVKMKIKGKTHECKVVKALNNHEREMRERQEIALKECQNSKGWSDEDRQYLQNKLKFNKEAKI